MFYMLLCVSKTELLYWCLVCQWLDESRNIVWICPWNCCLVISSKQQLI